MRNNVKQVCEIIEQEIMNELNNAHNGYGEWSVVMRPLGLLGVCDPSGQKGWASGFFVERLKQKGILKVHQAAKRKKKYLLSRNSNRFYSQEIRFI